MSINVVHCLRLRLLPELAFWQQARVQKKQYKAAKKELLSSLGWRFIIWYFVHFAMVIVGVMVLFAGLRLQQHAMPSLTMGVGVLLGMSMLLSRLTIMFLFRQRLRKTVRLLANLDGLCVCIDCGYDLRGCVSRKCPECGRPFYLCQDSRDHWKLNRR